jgi:hypothetical protein
MFNHEPDGYHCPFCRLSAGGEDDLTKRRDIALRHERALASLPGGGGRATAAMYWSCPRHITRTCMTCRRSRRRAHRRPRTGRSRRPRRRTRGGNRHPEHLRLRRHIYPPAQRTSRVPGCVALPRARFPAVRRRQPLCDSTSRSTGDGRRPRALRVQTPRVLRSTCVTGITGVPCPRRRPRSPSAALCAGRSV